MEKNDPSKRVLDMACLKKLDDKLSPERGKHNGEVRTVMACFACCDRLNEERLKTVPVETLRDKSRH